MSESKIKLPRSSYDELCKIIQAYGKFDKPESLSQVSTVARIGTTKISANNSFLLMLGIIEGGDKKIATSPGKILAKALDHDITDDIVSSWRNFVQNNEFLNKMVLSVRIRKSMDISAFGSHIAYSAGETKAKYVMTGARTVIDILEASRLIKEQDGKISAGTEVKPRIVVSDKTAEGETKSEPKEDGKIPIKVPTGIKSVNINIDVKIDVKPSELEGLGENLKKLLKTLSEYDKNKEKES